MNSFDSGAYDAGYEAGIRGEKCPVIPGADENVVAQGHTAGEAAWISPEEIQATHKWETREGKRWHAILPSPPPEKYRNTPRWADFVRYQKAWEARRGGRVFGRIGKQPNPVGWDRIEV